MDTSYQQKQSSSILGDIQAPLNDESMKRNVTQIEEREEKEEKRKNKKRRSSLSSHRRSITGDVPDFQLDRESSSQTSGDTGSQQSSSSDNAPTSSQSSTNDNAPTSSQSTTNDGNSLLPNPINLQMDDVIEKMQTKIRQLNDECSQWEDLLKSLVDRDEQTKLLAMNLTLPTSDIPEELKEMAVSEYIRCKPLDLLTTKKRLNNLLLQYQFDREACIKDLKLIKETVETIKNSNDCLKLHLAKALEGDTVMDSKEPGSIPQHVDPKELIQNVLNTC